MSYKSDSVFSAHEVRIRKARKTRAFLFIKNLK